MTSTSPRPKHRLRSLLPAVITVGIAAAAGLWAVGCGTDQGSTPTGAASEPSTEQAAPGASSPAGAPPPATDSGSTQVDADEALRVLRTIPVEYEHDRGYDRSRFDHWLDLDDDGCNTRQEVLIRDAVSPTTPTAGCWLEGGSWRSLYDGAETADVTDLEIDHVVALKEAWDSGAWEWDDAMRAAFANDLDDPRSLRAVTDGVNRSKRDADPSNWLPPDRGYWCTYLSDWVHIKARWGLSMDESEAGRIRNVLTESCR